MSVHATAGTALAREGRTIVHQLLDGTVDLSVLPTGPRTGSLDLRCTTAAEALDHAAAFDAGTPVDVVDETGWTLRCVMPAGERAEVTPVGTVWMVRVTSVVEVP